jgi:predicted Zn-dependent peptidase
MAADEKQAVTDVYTLELTLEEMAFLRLVLTNATIQPAELKKLCGEVQEKIEAQIGPLPPS